MIKRVVLCLFLVGFAVQSAYAGLYDASKDKRRGKNLVVKRNGDAVETTKRGSAVEGWDKQRFRAKTRTERRYDHNKDGYLSGDETRGVLAYRYNKIKSKNNPRVETEAETFFDLNKDGRLSKDEKDNIKRAIV